MTIDGEWAMTAESPVGEQQFTARLVAEGERLTGTLTGPQGRLEIAKGTVQGDEVTWSVSRAVMGMTLRFTGSVAGDELTGKVRVGMLGAFSARGVRSTERTEPEAEPENTGEAEPGLESPETRDDPYPFYARKRRQGPVQPMPGPMGTTAWLITGYDQARAALNDPRFSKHPRFAPQWLRDLGVISEGEGPTGANMLNTDPPDHTGSGGWSARGSRRAGSRPCGPGSRRSPTGC